MLKSFSGVVFGAALAAASSNGAAAPLGAFIGTSRVLVVSSPSATDPALAIQDQQLRAGAAGLRDRDVVVIRIVAKAVDGPDKLKLDAQSLRGAIGLRTDRFGVALIGKDGSEPLKRADPITMPSLFAAIDAMPMRRREIEERKR